ncbi:transposase family protein [Actinokineospora pegani]|uniref:transposase family protein n=1 Tax=Actinokineospora pegani TaxID=2654637 RepID=UPI0038B3D871
MGRLLHDERRRRGTRKDSRALTCCRQAVLGLRWFRQRADVTALGRDHGISRATAYRYLDEDIEVLGVLYAAAAQGLPTLADSGYTGASIGAHTPVRQPAGSQVLDIDTRIHNALLRGLRALGERGFAILTGRWRTLHHITASPSKIGNIIKAALVLAHFEHGKITHSR